MKNSLHPHMRLHVLLSVLAFLVVAGSITFYQMRKAPPTDEIFLGSQEVDKIDQVKVAKLNEMSRSLSIQKQTPEFKAKLEEMTKVLNKK